MRDRKPKKTAAELLAELNSDPSFVRESELREERTTREMALLAAEQAALISDLASAGLSVGSVWDLVNMKEPYPDAISILAKHLSVRYSPKIREGIARALSVPEARGRTARLVLNELKNSNSEAERHFRWALANALSIVGDSTLITDLRELLGNAKYKGEWPVIEAALTAIHQREG